MRISLKVTLIACALFVSQSSYAQPGCPTNNTDWAKRALQRSLTPQLGLPQTPHPVENQPSAEKIRLGRKLFFDRRLSINQTMSCAMCHVPEQGFTSNEMKTAIGVEGRSLKRNSPTVLNIGFLNVLFHDGRDFSLETQYLNPLLARAEMANPSAGIVVALLNGLEEYKSLFKAAFGAPASLDRIGMALGTYQRSLVAGNSAFDKWYFGKQPNALTAQQIRGFQIFDGAGKCTSCHLVNDRYALFTDQIFHDTGYSWQREKERQNPPKTIPVDLGGGIHVNLKYSVVKSVGSPPQPDLGRYEVTEKPEDRWKIRTPSLRNIAITAPYMHDGKLSTIRDVIEFYNRGGPNYARQDARIHKLGLSDTNMDDLEAFLLSLTAPNIKCLISEARVSPPDNH